MFGRTAALAVLNAASKASPAQETELRLLGRSSYLTRYSDNYIHQSVGENDVSVDIRAVNGRQIGTSSVNQMDAESLDRAVSEAHELSRLAPMTPGFSGLPDPQELQEAPGGFFDSTASCPPDLRAAYVERVIAMAKERGIKVAGALSTETRELCVVNSRGVEAYFAQTLASLTCVAMGSDSSGYADAFSPDVAQVDPSLVAERAIQKCLLSQDPIAIPPAEYVVILEPAAVAGMLMYLAFMGLTAESYQDGRSFMSGRMGQKVTGENITIWDDGLDPNGLPVPFDSEGVPKQKVMLVDRGTAAGVVYGSLAAAREGKKSTGHAVSHMLFSGSMPTNLFMAGGDSSVEEMVGGTKKGILVTRLNCINPVHPAKTIITGTTRDGTFLIEDGRITRGVKNLRFTESILGAFSRVEALSAQRERKCGLFSVVCPAIKVNGFTFTG
ncbi:MAG: TldD/PmbA family protein [Bacillota bacterium]